MAVAVAAASLMITTRLLGPEGRGVYAAAVAWATTFATIASLSLGQVTIHGAGGRDRDTWIPEVLGTILVLLLAVTLLVWLVAVAGFVATDGDIFSNLQPSSIALAFLGVPFLLVGDALRYVLNSANMLRTANRVQVLSALASLVATITFVGIARLGVVGALIGALVASGVMALGSLGALRDWLPRLVMSRPMARLLVSGGIRLHFSTVGTLLFAQAGILVLNHFRSPAETGAFQLAAQLFTITLIIPTSVGTVAFGLVAQLGVEAAWSSQRRLLAQALLAVGALAGVSYMLAPVAIHLVAGADFDAAIPLFRGMLPALVGATCSTVMASQWIGRGLFWQASALTLATGAASLACTLVLVPEQGSWGALVGMWVAYGLAAVANVVMAIRLERRVDPRLLSIAHISDTSR